MKKAVIAAGAPTLLADPSPSEGMHGASDKADMLGPPAPHERTATASRKRGDT